LACPYFIPRAMLNDGSWPHPSRLPLGAGWSGGCCASGQEVAAEERHVRDFCNLGYAKGCPHLPKDREWDAVRFTVANAGTKQVTLTYACELEHTPVTHGTLTYDLGSERWQNEHSDPRINRLAAGYLEAYRVRQRSLV
jgi:hypothetical protein